MDAIKVQNIGGPYKPVKKYPERKCIKCDKRLSIYNSLSICGICQRKL